MKPTPECDGCVMFQKLLLSSVHNLAALEIVRGKTGRGNLCFCGEGFILASTFFCVGSVAFFTLLLKNFHVRNTWIMISAAY